MGQTASNPSTAEIPSSCPVSHQSSATSETHPAPSSGCPVHNANSQKPLAQCPVDHSGLNPRNQMPVLSQAPSSTQSIALPTERSISSIPRDGSAKWEYPSPQQFYNALVRKGWETPEEHVETMVEIHNFLNEEAWNEVMKWEKRVGKSDDEQPYLARFQGRPGQLSPKARLYMLAGWLLPSRFNSEPPFDRHDWTIRRPNTNEEVRYVIDYYSAPPEPDGSPAFSLDVRPALDSFSSIKERIAVSTEEAWTAFRESSKNAAASSKPSPLKRDS